MQYAICVNVFKLISSCVLRSSTPFFIDIESSSVLMDIFNSTPFARSMDTERASADEDVGIPSDMCLWRALSVQASTKQQT